MDIYQSLIFKGGPGCFQLRENSKKNLIDITFVDEEGLEHNLSFETALIENLSEEILKRKNGWGSANLRAENQCQVKNDLLEIVLDEKDNPIRLAGNLYEEPMRFVFSSEDGEVDLRFNLDQAKQMLGYLKKVVDALTALNELGMISSLGVIKA